MHDKRREKRGKMMEVTAEKFALKEAAGVSGVGYACMRLSVCHAGGSTIRRSSSWY